MMEIFARKGPVAKVRAGAGRIADVLQEEGIFDETGRRALMQKKKEFVAKVVNAARKAVDLDFEFSHKITLVIDTRKKGKEFVFSEITVSSATSRIDPALLTRRLNEVALEHSF